MSFSRDGKLHFSVQDEVEDMENITKLFCKVLCNELTNQNHSYLLLDWQLLVILFSFGFTLRAYYLQMGWKAFPNMDFV